MQGLNRTYLIGNVVKVEACKDALLIVEIETPHSRKIDGEWSDGTITHRLVCSGKEADFVARHTKVGDVLAVEATIVPERVVARKDNSIYGASLRLDRVLSTASRSNHA